MGSLVTNVPDTFHMRGGVLVGLAKHVHLGSANYDHDLPEVSDVAGVLDLYRYAKEAGRTSRDGGFDTKAAALWGSDYSGMDAAYKDAVFFNVREFPFTPWPP